MEEGEARKDAGMEGWLARWYARTRRNDAAEFARQAEAVAARLGVRGDVLEVAPGPGYFAIALARLGDFRITGLDLSRTLVGIAAENAMKAGARIDFRIGNAASMPFAEGAFDFVYCAAAFKNFAAPVRALDEMHRVLRPGGEAMILDLRKDVPIAEIDAYVRASGRGAIDGWITRQAFRRMLIGRAYTREAFARMAAESRFGGCAIETDQIGLMVRLTKAGNG
ncbi:MAG TPA: class I SAM-dependent methyltransferase [Acetobacteraceae bacterium]|nr:class I SAM-dependent methyltransferase [Acetobacteraceae bacterium]